MAFLRRTAEQAHEDLAYNGAAQIDRDKLEHGLVGILTCVVAVHLAAAQSTLALLPLGARVERKQLAGQVLLDSHLPEALELFVRVNVFLLDLICKNHQVSVYGELEDLLYVVLGEHTASRIAWVDDHDSFAGIVYSLLKIVYVDFPVFAFVQLVSLLLDLHQVAVGCVQRLDWHGS